MKKGLPVPQSGEASSSSGRAGQRTTRATSRLSSTTCARSSRRFGSAQWMSSMTTTRGRFRARCSSACRAAQKTSSLDAGTVLRPMALARRSATRAPSRAPLSRARSFSMPASGVSLSRIDAARVEHLAQGPVGDALAVGKATPTQRRCATRDRGQELVDESSLPDTGRPDDRDQGRRTVPDRAREHRLDAVPVGVAAEHGCIAVGLPGAWPCGQRTRGERQGPGRPCLSPRWDRSVRRWRCRGRAATSPDPRESRRGLQPARGARPC